MKWSGVKSCRVVGRGARARVLRTVAAEAVAAATEAGAAPRRGVPCR